MSEGKRPGGLTALAVINFVWGGLSVLSILGAIFLINAPALFTQMRDEMVKQEKPQEQIDNMNREIAKTEAEIEKRGGARGIWIGAGISVVLGGILIVAGVGYLKQRRVLGRWFGNLYAIIGILAIVAFAVFLSLRFEMIVDLVYPVLTLILINTTFRDDLVQ